MLPFTSVNNNAAGLPTLVKGTPITCLEKQFLAPPSTVKELSTVQPAHSGSDQHMHFHLQISNKVTCRCLFSERAAHTEHHHGLQV